MANQAKVKKRRGEEESVSHDILLSLVRTALTQMRAHKHLNTSISVSFRKRRFCSSCSSPASHRILVVVRYHAGYPVCTGTSPIPLAKSVCLNLDLRTVASPVELLTSQRYSFLLP